MVWINGELVDENAAQISPFDHGLLTGDGVFETLIAYGSQPFATTLHWERLRRSAAAFGLDVPGDEELNAACEETIRANGISPARIRVTITGGRAPLGSEKGNSQQTMVVAAGAQHIAVPLCRIFKLQRAAQDILFFVRGGSGEACRGFGCALVAPAADGAHCFRIFSKSQARE